MVSLRRTNPCCSAKLSFMRLYTLLVEMECVSSCCQCFLQFTFWCHDRLGQREWVWHHHPSSDHEHVAVWLWFWKRQRFRIVSSLRLLDHARDNSCSARVSKVEWQCCDRRWVRGRRVWDPHSGSHCPQVLDAHKEPRVGSLQRP